MRESPPSLNILIDLTYTFGARACRTLRAARSARAQDYEERGVSYIIAGLREREVEDRVEEERVAASQLSNSATSRHMN